jgi:hypothetical protein
VEPQAIRDAELSVPARPAMRWAFKQGQYFAGSIRSSGGVEAFSARHVFEQGKGDK